MTSLAEAVTAPSRASEHQYGLRNLLQVDEEIAGPKDLLLVEKIRASRTPDDYQAFLIQPAVIDMFRRRAAYFGPTR